VVEIRFVLENYHILFSRAILSRNVHELVRFDLNEHLRPRVCNLRSTSVSEQGRIDDGLLTGRMFDDLWFCIFTGATVPVSLSLTLDFPCWSLDPSNFHPFLELRLLIREFVYSLQSGMLKIRCLEIDRQALIHRE
jgi:hypothetical protein